MLYINALKPIIFETNMFQKQRKCNKQKIKCFVDEYGRKRAYKAAQIPRSETQDIQIFKINPNKIVLL
jgi:hypothetical protein